MNMNIISVTLSFIHPVFKCKMHNTFLKIYENMKYFIVELKSFYLFVYNV